MPPRLRRVVQARAAAETAQGAILAVPVEVAVPDSSCLGLYRGYGFSIQDNRCQ